MLDLPIAMRTYFFLVTWILLHGMGQAVTPTPETAIISAPVAGQALQGQVEIIGMIAVPDFEVAEIWYSYSGGQGSFLIGQLREPIQNKPMVLWDTTIIADGNYDLHLRVFLTDGSVTDFSVNGLRVRNSTPIETNTPFVVDTLQAVNIPTEPFPSPTVRKTAMTPTSNEASVQDSALAAALLSGFFAIVILAIILGVYVGLRKGAGRL